MMNEPISPFISIIIPVFDDAERLALCLAALEGQTYPGDAYEVLVVDNGSKQSPAGVVAKYPHARLLVESKPGSYAARNKALGAARGAFLAFTDADCIPQPDWLERGVAALKALPNFGVVAGRIDMFYVDPRRPRWVELYDAATGLDQRRSVSVNAANTANLFTHRSVFDRVGLFDASLKSLGDVEWTLRAAAAGYPVAYGHDAVIRHPARSHLRDMMVKRRRTIGGEQDQKADKAELYRSTRMFRVLWQNFAPRVIHYWRLSQHERIKTRGQRCKVVAVMVLMQYVDAFERVRKRLGGSSVRR